MRELDFGAMFVGWLSGGLMTAGIIGLLQTLEFPLNRIPDEISAICVVSQNPVDTRKSALREPDAHLLICKGAGPSRHEYKLGANHETVN